MAGYDQNIKVKAAFHKEAKHFFRFLQRVGNKYPRPTRINYRYLGRGRFYVMVDGSPGGIDALFQELLISRGLYYYSCSVSKKREVVDHVVMPIYGQLVDARFSNSQTRFLRKHVLGKHAQNDFIPSDIRNQHGYNFEVMFRKWDIGLLTNRDYAISLDALLTEFLLTRSDHKEGGRSPRFSSVLHRIGSSIVIGHLRESTN